MKEKQESGELWVLWTEERAKFTCLANLNFLLVLLLKFRLSGEGEGGMDQQLKAFSTLTEELPSSLPSNYMAVYQLSVLHSIRSNVILCSLYMSGKHLLYAQAKILIQEKNHESKNIRSIDLAINLWDGNQESVCLFVPLGSYPDTDK